MPSSPQLEPTLTFPEQVLGEAMLQKNGTAVVAYALRDMYGLHWDDTSGNGDFNELVTAFEREPKESLAWARESLFAVPGDERLTPKQRERHLGRYIDAYFDLTIKLDHAAFPPTIPGVVRSGVPDYIPDGFVDLGGDRNLQTQLRSREKIVVDKREMFDRYREVVLSAFQDTKQQFPNNNTRQKLHMIDMVAEAVYYQLPYGYTKDYRGGGNINLSELPTGVCRHQALTTQVLLQAVGVTSRLIKCDARFNDNRGFERHAANLVRVNSQWALVDSTNPEYEQVRGRKILRPSHYEISEPPTPSEPRKNYDVVSNYADGRRQYRVHQDDMFWVIQ